jgi:hypothetical protein
MSFSSQHHSFDISLAKMYGVECAILIHHFQHWIRINRFGKRNLREGRCWTYQTRREIQMHFPYWNVDEVRRLTDKLVSLGVLLKNNFNKSKVDKTLWYAFVDEKAFGVDEESSNNLYERQKCQSTGEIANPVDESATPIPDTKNTDTKNTDKKEKDKKESSATPPPSADAEALFDFFLRKIKEKNPGFKNPNRSKWLTSLDALLRIDKRQLEEIKAILEWKFTNNFWMSKSNSPEALRRSYDNMVMQMVSDGEQQNADENRKYALEIKKEHPERLKNLTINSKYAMNLPVGKEVPFSLPRESFRRAFISMFGGVYEPNRSDQPRNSMEQGD